MTDIVDRLRAYAEANDMTGLYTEASCAYDAIQEIERLRNQKKELLDMVLENLENEYPEYKLKYERFNRRYKSEREYLIEEFRDD
jgi:hypothetical protein